MKINKEKMHWITVVLASIIAFALIFAHIIPKVKALNPGGYLSLNTLVTIDVMISMITVSILFVYLIICFIRKIKLWMKV